MIHIRWSSAAAMAITTRLHPRADAGAVFLRLKTGYHVPGPVVASARVVEAG